MSALVAENDFFTIKKYAVSVLASLSEKKMREFITLFADKNTIARMESEILVNDPQAKRYNNFKDFMKDMEREDD